MYIDMSKKDKQKVNKITPESIKKESKSLSTAEVDRVSSDRVSAMDKLLSKQPRMHIMIPLGIGEKKGATHEVCINGWVKSYPKGVMLEVPKTVFELLAEHFNITQSVGKELEIDRDTETQRALSGR